MLNKRHTYVAALILAAGTFFSDYSYSDAQEHNLTSPYKELKSQNVTVVTERDLEDMVYTALEKIDDVGKTENISVISDDANLPNGYARISSVDLLDREMYALKLRAETPDGKNTQILYHLSYISVTSHIRGTYEVTIYSNPIAHSIEEGCLDQVVDVDHDRYFIYVYIKGHDFAFDVSVQKPISSSIVSPETKFSSENFKFSRKLRNKLISIYERAVQIAKPDLDEIFKAQ